MSRLPAVFIWDVRHACAAIEAFVVGADLDRYRSDAMLRSAVERQLQNIGEALSQLSRIDPALAARVPRHRQLIGLRNILVHGYAGLNDEEVWAVLQANLPELHASVTALTLELGAPQTP